MNIRNFFIALSTRHDLYYRVFIIVASIFIITGFLPDQLRFKYDYKTGGVWNYENLIAPLDFAIYKSEKEIDIERAMIADNQPFYYRIDTTTKEKVTISFLAAYNNKDVHAIQTGKNIIHLVYQKGLVLPAEGTTSGSKIFFIVNGNIAHESSINELLVPNETAAFIERELISHNLQQDELLFNALIKSLVPNITFDEELTRTSINELTENISLTRGMVTKGTVIAEKGHVIKPSDAAIIESLRRAYDEQQPESSNSLVSYLGFLILVSAAIGLLIAFLIILRKDILLDNRKLTLLFLLIVGITLLFTLILKKQWVSILVVPLCILPLVTRAFFDTRTALFTHVLTTLILGTVAPNGFEFVFMQIIAGMVAIFSIVNMRRRSQLFVAVTLIFFTYLICFTGLSIINEGNINEIKLSSIAWLGGNILLTLFSYPLIFFIEKVFGVNSDFSLMELTDFNNSLLRELATKAPGTFQHSMQVANLAEAAIYKIGGNSLLVRVGALYHDIGKGEMPLYFIENQSTQMNPHDELWFDESASIIISHVIRGIEKAKKNSLPDAVIDFIRTHHGTMMVQYFYQSFLKNYPDQLPDEDDFRYPGPKPFSRETAVLMMADSVEASARSLTHHDSESIDKLVENVIGNQINNGQFENCDITYRDITSIKRIFKKMLSSIYHVRIAYPSQA